MATPVYIRLKQAVKVDSLSEVRLGHIARVAGPKRYSHSLHDLLVHHITPKDQNIVVIDGISIIDKVIRKFPTLDVELLGPSECVVHIEKAKKKPSIVMIIGIWILLFIGAAMAIMNFHYDVSMLEVQQKLHFMLTGEEAEHPLWIQVPYSIGLGIGMILFFNHWFKKRFNEEPSPLEVEVFKYQEDLDHYVAIHENKEGNKHVDR
ncbi:stage V sporulation protein AA [Halobacillus litoralis]|uniref:stage V sporulation protein AA n=1 Tax=Halobacillus litoralis TaxID=45668 RepID=UPI001CD4C870|nr:stage V sporulation protein AA [Halobacillus litoralis]MCA0970282.1 stage V sporulation protein AA [Halobacillus litoralis]